MSNFGARPRKFHSELERLQKRNEYLERQSLEDGGKISSLINLNNVLQAENKKLWNDLQLERMSNK